ncbi:MAG: hypothetical protein IPM35_04685 [Myxococcales bacterium]|nr:hypothetical protein [Myxococcales bacterium]
MARRASEQAAKLREALAPRPSAAMAVGEDDGEDGDEDGDDDGDDD